MIPALPGSDDDPGTGPAVRSLFAELVDDAAVFPPGLAPMEQAVPAHVGHARSWYGDLVGPFLVPTKDVDGFTAALGATGRSPLRVSVVAGADEDDPASSALAAAARLMAVDGVDVVALEVPLPRGVEQGAAADGLVPVLERGLPAGIRAWVEVHRAPGWRRALGRLGTSGDDVGAKFRTGGTAPEAFPTVDELAGFLRGAVDVDVAFKLTAGLHTAVRGPDTRTGAVHHGILNVLGGVRAALNGAEADEVAGVLAEESAARLASAVRRMSEADAAVLRAFFTSFGCCGVLDPVRDLAGLGMVEEGR